MRISDWSSDVCSSDLKARARLRRGSAQEVMTNRLAVFDCDGTLVDSQHSICAAMVRAFESEKLAAPDRAAILSVIGLSLPLAMARLLPDAEVGYHDHLSESYKLAFQQLRRENAVSEPLYPGIAALIRELDADGWLLGVATGKSRSEEHTSELQSLMRISYAVFCLKKKT